MGLLIAINSSHTTHTGSTIVGPIEGTVVSDPLDAFATLNGIPIATSSAIMDIPSHQVLPLVFHSHQYNPTSIPQTFAFINNKPIAVIGSSYPDDETVIDEPIGQLFADLVPLV